MGESLYEVYLEHGHIDEVRRVLISCIIPQLISGYDEHNWIAVMVNAQMLQDLGIKDERQAEEKLQEIANALQTIRIRVSNESGVIVDKRAVENCLFTSDPAASAIFKIRPSSDFGSESWPLLIALIIGHSVYDVKVKSNLL